MPHRLVLLLVLALAAVGCRAVKHPAIVWSTPSSSVTAETWDEVFKDAIEVEVDVVVSAEWTVPKKGLIDLSHPKAKEAGLENEKMDIVLPVGIIRHPTGDLIVDTGIDATLAVGEPVAIKGPLKALAKDVEPKQNLGAIVARRGLDIHGVLLTHMHFDHVLGLPDLPAHTPIYTGPGEVDERRAFNIPMRRTYRALFAGRAPLREFNLDQGMELDPFESVIDVMGDGSVWAIPSPGHTGGSMAYLVNAKSGPVLFVGDTSHTKWGWENGVTPGSYTADRELNAESLERLRKFVERYPQIKVVVGHEL